jgi:hypothetical protein
MRGLFVVVVLLGVSRGALAAPPVGYAQASGYYKKDSRPTLYQPLNLLDAREATQWCTTSGDPLEDTLTFGFKGIAKIDEIRVYTGNGFDEKTFAEFARAKKLSIKGPTSARTFTVADQRGLQVVPMDPPITGAQLTIEVLESYPPEDIDAPVCITDIVFYSDGKPLNGPWLTPKLKFDRRKAVILGTWFAGYEGAPDRFLSFYFDGTYRVVFDPFDPQVKDRAWGGEYELTSSGVVLQIPNKGRVTAKLKKGKAEDTRELSIEGGDVPEDLKQAFRSKM